MSDSVNVQYVEAADDGTLIPVNDLEHDYTYSGSLIATDTLVYKTKKYRKTYTWTGSNLTNETIWELQA